MIIIIIIIISLMIQIILLSGDDLWYKYIIIRILILNDNLFYLWFN